MASILELLYGLGVDVRDSNEEAEKTICCPFCPERAGKIDEKFHLGLNVENGKAHCYRCGWSLGRDVDSDSQRARKLFVELREAFGAGSEWMPDDFRDEIRTKKKRAEPERLAVVSLPDEYEPLHSGRGGDRLTRLAKDYLAKREITSEQIKRFQIGFCATGKYAHRIIIPIVFSRSIVGFTGRSIWNDVEPKYYNSPGLKALFNFPSTKDRRDKALLVEGPFDVLRAEPWLDDYSVVGMLGSAVTEFQAKCLRKFCSVTLWTDMDKAGLSAVRRVKDALEGSNTQMRVVVTDDLRDPGSLPGREIRRIVKECSRPYSSSVMTKMRCRVAFA